jgi:arsenate reductase
MTERTLNVLFLCTHNSARSVLAESTLNALGGGRFQGFSAGSHPSGRVNPQALALLKSLGHDIATLRSKSWDEFAKPGAPRLDIVITVCGDAADETCPVWPGTPLRAHWGLPDPSRVEGHDAAKQAAFAETQSALAQRIAKLVELPLDQLNSQALARIHETSRMPLLSTRETPGAVA